MWQPSRSWWHEAGQLWQARQPNCVDGIHVVHVWWKDNDDFFPDALLRMVSCTVHVEQIMVLCGETKIATIIFMTKAFESMSSDVTCFQYASYQMAILVLGYYPDIVENYSANVVNTFHKKNLLGEDWYLTTLMMKTLFKCKNVLCVQTVCKIIVHKTFHVFFLSDVIWSIWPFIA